MKKLALFICFVMLMGICAQAEYEYLPEDGVLFVMQDGDEKLLFGHTWMLSDKEETEDGYHKVYAQDGNEKSTFYTTNILRVNQRECEEVFSNALSAYLEIENARVRCNEYLYECRKSFSQVNQLANALIQKLSGAAEESEEYGVLENVEKTLANCEKKLNDAEILMQTVTEQKEIALDALDLAAEALKMAYEVDAQYAWITEDKVKNAKAYMEAYPEYLGEVMAEVFSGDFAEFLTEFYPTRFEAFTQVANAKKVVDMFSKYLFGTYNPEYGVPVLSEYEKNQVREAFTASKTNLTDEEIIQIGSRIIDKAEEDISAPFMEKLDENGFANHYEMETYVISARKQRVEGKLEAYKKTSAEAAAKADQAQKMSDAALKAGAQKATSDKMKKDWDAIVKAYSQMPSTEYGVTPEPIHSPKYEEIKPDLKSTNDYIDYELNQKMRAASKEPVLMETPCTVKLKKGTITVTCANGESYTGKFNVHFSLENDQSEATAKSYFK